VDLVSVCSSVIPVLASGVSWARTIGHHLIWMLMWIGLWRAVHRFGWLMVCVLILTVLGVATVVAQRRKHRATARRRVSWPTRRYDRTR
jgi:hypothetical protein